MSKPKECPHLNTVQSGNPGIIETFCTDCNEKIRVQHFGLPYGKVDSHGDVLMPGCFDISNTGKYIFKNHPSL